MAAELSHDRPPPGESDPFDGPGWDEGGAHRVGAEPVRLRRRVRTRRRRRARRLLLGAGIGALAVLAALGWLAYSAARARTQLVAVRAEVTTLRGQIAAGDLAGARVSAARLREHAARAHDLTTGPLWAGAAAVPFLGAPLDTVRVLSASVDRVAATSLTPLVEAGAALDPHTLRRADGSIDLAPVERVAPLLGGAARAMQDAVRQLAASPASTWSGTVDSARADLLAQLPPLITTVRNADLAARTLPALLGADGPRRYLVSFENEAELRGLGGLPGAFAILQADHGRLTFLRFESDTALVGHPSGVRLGAEFERQYASTPDATTSYLDSNLSPHFPYAARLWLGSWRQKTGQQLDGAMTLDPTAISYLLAVTGPARLPDGTSVSAANVVSLTQQRAYDSFGTDTTARKAFLLDVARAVSRTLVRGGTDPAGLVRAATRAAAEGRLLVWTRDASIEDQLAGTAIGGQVPVTSAPYAGLSINNAGATKLDYYLHAAVDWTSAGCGTTREVTVTIRLRNAAPAGLPAYVLGFTGQPGFRVRPGVNRTLLTYFGSAGGRLSAVTVDGRAATASIGSERSHPAYGMVLDLPAGATRTIVLRLLEPGAAGAPITRMQPMVDPVALAVSPGRCAS